MGQFAGWVGVGVGVDVGLSDGDGDGAVAGLAQLNSGSVTRATNSSNNDPFLIVMFSSSQFLLLTNLSYAAIFRLRAIVGVFISPSVPIVPIPYNTALQLVK